MNVMDRGFGYDAALDPESNCTLEMYAAAKALPVDFLGSLGVATTANPYAPRRLALAIRTGCRRQSAPQAHPRRSHQKQRRPGSSDAVGPAARGTRDHPLWT